MHRVFKIAFAAATIAAPIAGHAATAADHAAHARLAAEKAPAPKVTKAEAEKIALDAARGGTIISSEYEKENGTWRWSFDIRQNGKVHEIGVDGMTGKIVEDSWEDAKSEAREAD